MTRFTVALAGVLLLGACASMGGGEAEKAGAIGARQNAMKAIGTASGVLRAPTLDPAAARAAGTTINTNLKVFAANLPKGSGVDSGMATKAKSEIWTSSDGFNNALNTAISASEALANSTGEAAALQGQVRAVMGACAGCHTTYRGA